MKNKQISLLKPEGPCHCSLSDYLNVFRVNLCLCSTEAVISSTAIFVEIANNTLYGSQLYIFILFQKSLDIKIMFHEDIPTVNISKRNYWLVICIAKNFIWTTLKMISQYLDFFLHPQIPDFQNFYNTSNIAFAADKAQANQ